MGSGRSMFQLTSSLLPLCLVAVGTPESTLRRFKGVWYDRSWRQPFYRMSSANYPAVVSQNRPFKRRRFQLKSAETPEQPRSLRYTPANMTNTGNPEPCLSHRAWHTLEEWELAYGVIKPLSLYREISQHPELYSQSVEDEHGELGLQNRAVS